MKQAILAVAIIGLLVRVYFVYHGTQVQSAAQTSKSQPAAAVAGAPKIPAATPTASAAAAAAPPNARRSSRRSGRCI